MPASRRTPDSAVRADAPRILYVDDEAALRRSFARTARELGFDVDLAASGTEAFTLARRFLYTVVASDLCMPILDGLEVIEAIHKTQPDASYILVTGRDRLDLPRDSRGARALTAIVHKPWDAEQLARVITDATAIHQQRRSSIPNATVATPPTTVLLIENDPADAALTREMLNGAHAGGYAITSVGRLHDALRLVQRRCFDIVLADLSLPDARGLDVVRHLLARSPAPLLVITGSEDDALAIQAIRAGAQDHLPKKDLTGDLLERSIHYSIERARSVRKLESLAYSDPLTGLPNRNLFFDRLERATTAARRRDTRVAVIFADLDYFKMVNDDLGHDAGDRVLRSAAGRLVDCVRESDTVARMGGDEFALILGDCGGDADVERVTDRILNAMETPIPVANRNVVVGVSLGVATFPENAEDYEDLLRAADTAMYESKRNGRARVSIAARAAR